MAEQTTPNLVFVITDDQGYGDLGCTGNPTINTPNLDALADESVQLQNLHVGPTCSPTRAGYYDRTLLQLYRRMAYHRWTLTPPQRRDHDGGYLPTQRL